MDISDFYSLLQIHKQEAAEGLSYITTHTTVVLGILAYFGAVSNIRTLIRIGIVIGFLGFTIINLSAILAARDMHQSIHAEIEERLKENPYLIKSEELKCRLEMPDRLPEKYEIAFSILLFDFMMVCGILFYGKNNLYDSIKKRKWRRSKSAR